MRLSTENQSLQPTIQFNLDFTDRVNDSSNRGENIEIENESVLKGCLEVL